MAGRAQEGLLECYSFLDLVAFLSGCLLWAKPLSCALGVRVFFCLRFRTLTGRLQMVDCGHFTREPNEPIGMCFSFLFSFFN